MKFRRADSHVRTQSFSNFSGTPFRVGQPSISLGAAKPPAHPEDKTDDSSVLVLPAHPEDKFDDSTISVLPNH